MGLTLIYPALPTCLVGYVQKSGFHLINVFCEGIALKKYTMSSPGSFVLHSSKIPLMLTTKVTHFRSLLFRQPDEVNCVLYLEESILGFVPKQSSAVSGLRMLTVAST